MKMTLIVMIGVTFGLLGMFDNAYGSEIPVRFAKRSIPVSAVKSNVKQKSEPAQPAQTDRVSVSKRRLESLFKSGKLKNKLSDRHVAALILQESDGRNGLIGDKHLGSSSRWAWGQLQVRQCYVDDVNQKCQTKIYASDCRYDLELSILVTQAYMNRYASGNATFETMARIHNGGPNGVNVPKTDKYWKEVRVELASLTDKRIKQLVVK